MSANLDTALQAIEFAKRAGAREADAWLKTERTFSVTVRDGEVEQLLEADSLVLGLRTFLDDRVATVFSSDLSAGALRELSGQAVKLAQLSDADACVGLPDGPFADGFDADSLELHDPTLFDHDPEELVARAREAERAARGFDPRITNSEGASFTRQTGATFLANSRGFSGAYRASSCSLGVSVLADDADHKKRRDYWETTGCHFDRLEDAEEVGRKAAGRTIRRLGARKVATQQVPVVWSPEMAREFLEWVLAAAASGELRYRGSTFLIDREGDRIASPLVTMVDDATLRGRLGSRPFDGEGLASRRTPVFERGVFNGFLFDSYSACRAGRESTANAGRAVDARLGLTVGVRPSNLTLEGGEDTPDEIIAGVERGLYLTEMLGFGENLTTGDFSRGAAGVWIDGGQLAYPVSEINIAGRLQDMLAGIDAVGDDVAVLGSVAAPTFRIAEMTVSGT